MAEKIQTNGGQENVKVVQNRESEKRESKQKKIVQSQVCLTNIHCRLNELHSLEPMPAKFLNKFAMHVSVHVEFTYTINVNTTHVDPSNTYKHSEFISSIFEAFLPSYMRRYITEAPYTILCQCCSKHFCRFTD